MYKKAIAFEEAQLNENEICHKITEELRMCYLTSEIDFSSSPCESPFLEHL